MVIPPLSLPKKEQPSKPQEFNIIKIIMLKSQ